ncbi:MAG: GNAT family N-acetyltransferase [Clostridiales bacterium]|nr:GNAT family N-acetyltransferase [Clostridiales bacterium]
MITVKAVKTKKEQKEFLDFPLKLYKNNPYYVPPLYSDEKKIFRNDYVYLDQAEAVYFNAYDDTGKIVGRISGILQRASNEKNNEKRVRFTRFDAVDDQRVADALFDAVEKWAKSKGMDTVCGPLGFSDLEREGLLIEGFNYLATFEEQYNYDYYQRLIENCGYSKEVDWVGFQLRAPKEQNDRLERLSGLMMKKYNLHIGPAKNTKDFIKRYSDGFFEILDSTYVDIYGTVPFTDGMKKMMIDNFKLIVNVKNVMVILDENDRIVCFGIFFPSIAKAVQKSGGHLTVPTLFRLLKAIKQPKVFDLGLIGVLPEYARKGISSLLIAKVIKSMREQNIEHAETNLNLETNSNIINQWKSFDTTQHKRHRCFIKKIDG